ncbi:hypothetical protein CSB37_01335 [bacterium DOLZORAL124_38_8]|nr:MAG: hypothetical protein CSB37_01335 [bacterium DOLZORAL124_38_8]
MRRRTNVSTKKSLTKKNIRWFFWGFFLLGFGWLVWQWNAFFAGHSHLVPQEGGVYTEDIVGEFNNTNPLSESLGEFDKSLQRLIYAGLVEYSPVTEQFEPALATFRITNNGEKYTLTLKDSARFSNGDPVTMDDVAFTFKEVIQSPGFLSPLLKERFEYVTINILSDRVVEFVLPVANVSFLQALTTPILQKKQFAGASLKEILDAQYRANRSPVGAGPFRLKNIVHKPDGTSRVFLQRNPYYFKATPYLKDIVFEVSTRAKLPAENKSTACINCSKVQSDEAVVEQRAYELPRYVGLFFNTEGEWGQYQAVRNALQFGVDRTVLLEGNEGWNITNSPFASWGIYDEWLFSGQLGRRSLIDGGFKWDKEKQTRFYKGKPVVIKMLVSTQPPVFSRFAQQIQRQWQKHLGVEVDLQILEPELFLNAVATRSYDVVLTGVDFSDIFNPTAVWHSQQSGKLNLANLTNDGVDSLVREYQLFGSKSDLGLLHEKLRKLGVVLPLFTPKYTWFVAKELKGVSRNFKKLPKHSDRFFGVESWYLNEKKDWDIPANKTKLGMFFEFLFGTNS